MFVIARALAPVAISGCRRVRTRQFLHRRAGVVAPYGELLFIPKARILERKVFVITADYRR